MKSKRVVISLGGSLVVPHDIDVKFLRQFKSLIESYVRRGWQFVIVVGGGYTARRYQSAIQKITVLKRDDLDWLGIHATRINAHLLRSIFKTKAYAHVVTDPTKKEGGQHDIIIASGSEPGWSTDYVAVRLAKTYGTKMIINLSNIAYVYSADPKKDSQAKPIKEMNWFEFRKLVGNVWRPGANLPFDPVASRLAEQLGYGVIIVGGSRLVNLDNILQGRQFRGTTIGFAKTLTFSHL